MVPICDQVMAGLSCFPWNGSNCSVHDMELLLTNSSLTDFHIESTLMKISHHQDLHGVPFSDHHAFLPPFVLESIISAYKSLRTGKAGIKQEQLLEVENRIISGDVESVAGVLHLPNHWTSLVITFKPPPRIFYGDSLGNQMPSDRAPSFKRWVCHMLARSGQQIPESDISIYPLPTGIQIDPISCGLFALNAISHYYLPQEISLLHSGNLSLPHYRLELALELLQEDTVSHFLYRTQMLSLIVHHRLQSMTQVSHLHSSTSPPLSLFNHFQRNSLLLLLLPIRE